MSDTNTPGSPVGSELELYTEGSRAFREANALREALTEKSDEALAAFRSVHTAYERVRSENAALRRENLRQGLAYGQRQALIERMKEAFGVLYQVLGQVGAPERILDLANNAANGEVPLEVSDVLPVRPEEFDVLPVRPEEFDGMLVPTRVSVVRIERPGVWTFVPDAPSIETGEPL